MAESTENPEPRYPRGGRGDDEPPLVIAAEGWRFHHVGIPTAIPHSGERYLSQYGMYVSGFETSPYGIEWMRFEEGSPIQKLVRTIPHLCFEVDDIETALRGRHVISETASPSEGVRAAMIVHDGAPIELIEFRKK